MSNSDWEFMDQGKVEPREFFEEAYLFCVYDEAGEEVGIIVDGIPLIAHNEETLASIRKIAKEYYDETRNPVHLIKLSHRELLEEDCFSGEA